MVFLGVDLVNGKPVKWKVENSWGDKVGKQGIFIMNHNWFEEHLYSLIIHKKYLTKKTLNIETTIISTNPIRVFVLTCFRD